MQVRLHKTGILAVTVTLAFAAPAALRPGAASGQTASPPAAPDVKKCKADFKAKQHKAAEECFRKVLAVEPTVANKVWLGLSLEEQHRYTEAWTEYSRAVELAESTRPAAPPEPPAALQKPSPDAQKAAAAAKKAAETAKKHEDTAKNNRDVVEARLTLVRFDAAAPQQLVFQIDGQPHAARSGEDVALDPGKRQVSVFSASAQASAGPLWQGVIDGKAGEKYRIVAHAQGSPPVAVAPTPPGPASAPAPDGTGGGVGQTPGLNNPGGLPGNPPCKQGFSNFVPCGGAPPSPPYPDASAPPPASPFKFVLGGVGVAGVAAGAVMGILAIQTKDDLLARCSGAVCPGAAEPLKDSAVLLGNGAVVALAIGGTALAGAVIWHFTADRSRASAGASLRIGPGTIGFQKEL